MTPKELGPYLLLRKLSEDALCETYRAGQHTGQDVEHLVLLYLFARDPANALWISETAQAGRRALAGLESPCLAPAIDSGEEAGVAYLTYDYIPGRSLHSVLERVREREQSLGVEHALLITERVAQGLLAAWEHESRVLHGFVVPQLVMLSNEGDVRLLGIEVASRLRKLLADPEVQREMGGYLAPEVVPEGQPATTDDVYSLGAILYGMVTGKALPASPVDDLETRIVEATAADGSPLPEAVLSLLHGSLVDYSRRTDLRTWHGQLSSLLTSGEYDADAFQLALFMHTLFGEEIEAEEDREGERIGASADIERAIADLAPLTEIAGDSSDSTADVVPAAFDDVAVQETDAPEQAASGNRRFALAAAIAALALLSFGAWWFFGGRSGDDLQASLTPTPAMPRVAVERDDSTSDPSSEGRPDLAAQPDESPAGEATEQAAQETAGLTAEEIDRRVQELLSQRSADMESSLRQEFESKVTELQQQLEQARQRQAEESTDDTPPQDEPAREDGVQLASLPLAVGDPSVGSLTDSADVSGEEETGEPIEESAPVESSSGAFGDMATESIGANDTEAPQTPPVQPPATARRETTPEPQRQEPLRQAAAQPVDPPIEEPAATEPAEPTVQPGDLVAPGPGVTIPKLARAAQPVYPMMARRLKKKAIVTVRVLIDENGRVLEAERLGEEAGYGFDDAAVQAARKSDWQAADKNGVPVKMWTTVRIAFEP